MIFKTASEAKLMETQPDNGMWIEGRPDFADWQFGKTRLAKHPKYVYGTSRQSMLIHKIAYVTAHWYEAHYDRMLRLETPNLVATALCGQIFFVQLRHDRRKFTASMCEIPKPDAVLCGACHGEPRPFGKYGKPPCSKEIAKVRLGCLVRGKS